MYEVSLFTSGRVEDEIVSDAQESLFLIEKVLEDARFFEMDQVEKAGSLGAFLAWMSGDRALVRVDQHREHYAYAPGEQQDPESLDVEFMGNNGAPFLHTVHFTVSRMQAWDTLKVWLAVGEWTTALRWT